MPASAREQGAPHLTQLTPEDVFASQRAREVRLARFVILYVCTGLFFMLLPGTFLGVWNLISISSRHQALSVSPSWIQAHGHAQIFGWIGSFILGIGFHSIPKMRRLEPFSLGVCSATWALWTTGVLLRWLANIYLWRWRVLLPLSAVLELLAFSLFFRAVAGHKSASEQKAVLEPWVLVVIAGTLGFAGMLLANLGGTIYASLEGRSPAFPHGFDQRYLVLSAWGFIVPFIWGFSAKWLPVFLGLKTPYTRLLLAAVGVNLAGVCAALAGYVPVAVVLAPVAALLGIVALRLFVAPLQPPKVKGVHSSFPVFIRVAYVWLMIAALLGVWAGFDDSAGLWGASRHALTVGFVATMVFSIGQRVLPAFSGMRLLFSPRLMAIGLVLLNIGCVLRVSGEIFAYQNYLASAWKWLPLSALAELGGVTLFAVNLLWTFARPPAAQAA